MAERAAARRAAGAELVRLLAPWRARLALVALGVAGAAGLELVPPLVVRHVIDANLVPGRPGGLAAAAALYLVATTARQGLAVVYGYQAAAVAQGMLHALRVRLFSHICRLPTDYHDRTPVGDTVSRCTADLDTLHELVTRGVIVLVAELFPLVAVGGAMVALSPPLSLAALVVLPPVVVIGRLIRARVRDAQRANRAAVGRLASRVHEDLAGVDVVKAFRKEGFFVARFRGVVRETLAAFNRANIYNTFYGPVIGLVAAAITAGLLWAGAGGLLGAGGVSIGTLAAFVLLFQRFVQPITALAEQWQAVQEALAGADRVFEVLALPVDERPSETPAGSGPRPATVDVDGLTFGYVPGRPVLRGIDFLARPGEHVVVVGRTGAGKSTLLELLAGLRTPWSGTVRLSGADARSIADEDRRGVLGFVPQRIQLFSSTLADNVGLDDPRVDAARIGRALAQVGAGDLASSLPAGLATRLAGVGHGHGLALSAGERQMVALARALVLDPGIVLLDEASAFVDPAAEAALGAALREAVCGQGGALVTVAHRLATACAADRVLVLDDGVVVEHGSPAALLAAGGVFAALVGQDGANAIGA